MIDFHILNAIKVVDGKALIEGRCMYGPIKPGQKLNTVFRLSSYITPSGSADATRELICTVDLKVESIWAYGKFLPEISQMMSARLEISGTGIDKIQPGLALSCTENDATNSGKMLK